MAPSTDLPRCSYFKDVLSRGCQKRRTNGSPTECFGPRERSERGERPKVLVSRRGILSPCRDSTASAICSPGQENHKMMLPPRT